MAPVAASFAMGACRCSSDETALGMDAGVGSDAGAGASPTTTVPSSSGTVGGAGGGPMACLPPPPPPEPCPGWPGWETWYDFSDRCPFCVPESEASLPEPIEWEPCPAASGWPDGACRWMKVTWPWETSPISVVAAVDTTVPDKTYVRIIRYSKPEDWTMSLVAEADGPVRFAMLKYAYASEDGCWNMFEHVGASIQHGKLVDDIDGDHVGPANDSFAEVIIGASIGELRPRVLAYWPVTSGYTATTSDSHWGVRDVDWIAMARWGEPACPNPLRTVFTSAEAGGLQQLDLFPWHDFAFWRSSNLYHAEVMAWTPDAGAYPFITYPGDWSQSVEGLGTDGVDMVWTYGEGKEDWNSPFASRSVMTAPFTKEPSELAARRLRSYPTEYPVVARWAVGCGYAAYNHEGSLGDVLIVRLSDGVSWILDAPCGMGGWCYERVYAVTCDEIFLHAAIGTWNIARIRLDALGPGLAPD